MFDDIPMWVILLISAAVICAGGAVAVAIVAINGGEDNGD